MQYFLEFSRREKGLTTLKRGENCLLFCLRVFAFSEFSVCPSPITLVPKLEVQTHLGFMGKVTVKEGFPLISLHFKSTVNYKQTITEIT